MDKPLLTPFAPGDEVIIPKGTITWYRGRLVVTRVARTITVHHTGNGYIQARVGTRVLRDSIALQCQRPFICWAGTGGYWREAPVSDAILAANSVTAEVNESNWEMWRHEVAHQKRRRGTGSPSLR